MHSFHQFLIFIAEYISKLDQIPQFMILARGKDWCYIKYQNKRILLIKGSKGLKHWLTNLLPYGWESASRRIAIDFEQTWIWDKPEYIAGYSRGGAIALLLAEDWDGQVIALGCPNVSAKPLKLGKVPVFINASHDFITKIPPWNTKPVPHIALYTRGWRHSPQAIRLLKPYQVKQVADILGWKNRASSVPTLLDLQRQI